MEIWEPKPPGTLWATPGLLRDCCTFTVCDVCDGLCCVICYRGEKSYGQLSDTGSTVHSGQLSDTGSTVHSGQLADTGSTVHSGQLAE